MLHYQFVHRKISTLTFETDHVDNGTNNIQKTKYIEVTKKPTDTKMLKIGDQEYERVKEFKCLGLILTEDNDINTEIK